MNIFDAIKNRRAVYPKDYLDKPISQMELLSILEYGNYAPTHKRTEPWRFKAIISNESKQALKGFVTETLNEHLPPEQAVVKAEKTSIKIDKSAAVVAIINHLDEAKRVPEWEEVAATAMAVQNIWLACEAKGIGMYWSSPKLIINQFSNFSKLKPNEVCLGFMYMGYKNENNYPHKRFSQMVQKIEWL